MNCIWCNAEVNFGPSVAYRDWCDECFVSRPLSDRWPKTTAQELQEITALMVYLENKRKARIAKKKENNEETKGKRKGKSKKQEEVKVNDLFYYED